MADHGILVIELDGRALLKTEIDTSMRPRLAEQTAQLITDTVEGSYLPINGKFVHKDELHRQLRKGILDALTAAKAIRNGQFFVCRGSMHVPGLRYVVREKKAEEEIFRPWDELHIDEEDAGRIRSLLENETHNTVSAHLRTAA